MSCSRKQWWQTGDSFPIIFVFSPILIDVSIWRLWCGQFFNGLRAPMQGGWQDHEDKERKYWWTCKKCPNVQRTVSGKGGKYCRTCNVRRAFRHCVQKLCGGRHECCALSSNKQTITRSLVRLDTTIPFWILCRVSQVHRLTQKQVGWGICLGSEGETWLTLSSKTWDRHQGTLSKSTNRSKTVSAPICLTSEPSNRQDVLRGTVQGRSAHTKCIPS